MDRMRAHSKLVQICLASNYSPSILEILDYRRIEGTGECVKYPGGACGGQGTSANVVLYGDQSTIKR